LTLRLFPHLSSIPQRSTQHVISRRVSASTTLTSPLARQYDTLFYKPIQQYDQPRRAMNRRKSDRNILVIFVLEFLHYLKYVLF
jgi:hypothetical protein